MLFFNAICRGKEVTNPALVGMNQLTYDVRCLNSGTIRNWIRERYIPISMMSVPPSCIESRISTASATVGYTAVMQVINARLVCKESQNGPTDSFFS